MGPRKPRRRLYLHLMAAFVVTWKVTQSIPVGCQSEERVDPWTGRSVAVSTTLGMCWKTSTRNMRAEFQTREAAEAFVASRPTQNDLLFGNNPIISDVAITEEVD